MKEFRVTSPVDAQHPLPPLLIKHRFILRLYDSYRRDVIISIAVRPVNERDRCDAIGRVYIK